MNASPGDRFGRLTFISCVDRGRHHKWLCKCDCGKTKVAFKDNIVRGLTKSCGCLHTDAMTTHGRSRSGEYSCWESMISRCTNPRTASFKWYGAKGITVCDEWRSFENFIRDMGDRPSAKHSIDRINNSVGYSKDNCRWATAVQQARNTSRCRRLVVGNVSQTIPEWAAVQGIPVETIRARLRNGWSVRDAITNRKAIAK